MLSITRKGEKIAIIVILIFILIPFLPGISKINYQADKPNATDGYRITDTLNNGSVTLVINFTSSSPVFTENEKIQMDIEFNRYWNPYLSTYIDITNEEGNHDPDFVNVTLSNKTNTWTHNRIEPKNLEKVTSIGGHRWKSSINISFLYSGSYGLYFHTTDTSNVGDSSSKTILNLLDVRTIIDRDQTLAIYEQRETNAKTTGLAYLATVIALWGIILSVFWNKSQNGKKLS